jgi:hypothetical protein
MALAKEVLIQAVVKETENETRVTTMADDKLDSVALDKAINMYHPTNGGESFGICSSVGRYPMLKCCESKITPLAKEIGLGPTMFLMSSKALSVLFFFLTVINLPVYLFYYSSNDYEVQNIPIDFFPKLSLGNIGQAENSCSSANHVTSSEISFTCSSNFAKLSDLKFVGIIQTNETTCNSAL